MVAATTYATLVADIQRYTSRGQATDTSFLAEIPRIITKVEFELAQKCKTLITQPPITGTLSPGDPIIQKPARWRNTLYFNITVSVDALNPSTFTKRKTLYLRPYETVVQYWPDRSATASALVGPKFYCDYDINHWLLGGTPALAYPYEFIIDERVAPLTEDNQTNFFTEFLPNLLLDGCLRESFRFLKNASQVAIYDAAFNDGLAAAIGEEKDRQSDKTQNVNNG